MNKTSDNASTNNINMSKNTFNEKIGHLIKSKKKGKKRSTPFQIVYALKGAIFKFSLLPNMVSCQE